MKSKKTLTMAGLAITSATSTSSSSGTSTTMNRCSRTSPPAAVSALIRNIHDLTTIDGHEINSRIDKARNEQDSGIQIRSPMKWNRSTLDSLSLFPRGGDGGDTDEQQEIKHDDPEENEKTKHRNQQEIHKEETDTTTATTTADAVGEDHVLADSSLDDGGNKRKKKKKKGKKGKTSSQDKERENVFPKEEQRKGTNPQKSSSINDAKFAFEEKKQTSSRPSSSTSSSSSPPFSSLDKKTKKETQSSASNEKTTNQKQNDVMEEIIQSTDLYHILSLDKSKRSSLTSAQITKAYRRRAVLTHPDKVNGDRRAFDKVSEAYDILSDETKKKIYDRFGLDAVKDPDFAARYASNSSVGVGGMSSAFSSMSESFHDHILRNFFGGVGVGSSTFGSSSTSSFFKGKSSSPQHARNHNVRYELELTLEDMYKGFHADVPITQPNGSPRTVKVDIPPGIVSGSTIRLPGMVDHVRDATPGDVIFIIRQRSHGTFTRKGHDLAMEMNISLGEAIHGFQKEIVHLDKRGIWIQSPRDAMGVPLVIQTGDVHVLKGEGMPKRNNHHGDVSAWLDHEEEEQQHEDGQVHLEDRCKHFGDLYIQYVVQMPNTQQSNLQNLSIDERKTLAMLLDKLEGVTAPQEETRDMPNESNTKPMRCLQKSNASDFGCASGIATPQRDDEDDVMYEDDDYIGDSGRNHQHHRSRSFHQYFTAGGPAGPFFPRGTFPFATSSSSYTSGTDEGDVQCQQM